MQGGHRVFQSCGQVAGSPATSRHEHHQSKGRVVGIYKFSGLIVARAGTGPGEVGYALLQIASASAEDFPIAMVSPLSTTR
jgi:hypothetical protein